jgi:putative oxidoreductase
VFYQSTNYIHLKRKKALYWTAKIYISLFIFFSAYFSYSHATDLRLLGFPDYFRIELVIAKCIGGTLLLIPQTGRLLKEWIYAGFCICMVSAFIAHACSHDPVSRLLFVGIDFVLILLSIRYVRRYEYGGVTQTIAT